MTTGFSIILDHYNQKKYLVNGLQELNNLYNNWKNKSPNKVVTETQLHRAIVKGSHQRRLANIAINDAIAKLKLYNDLSDIRNAKFKSFDELHKHVSNQILSIKGISHLTVYDTAIKIGELLKPRLRPIDYVYVARGTLTGAKKLLGKQVVKNNLVDRIKLPICLFQQYFPNIESIDLEVILCIYKDYFIKGGVISDIKNPQDIDNLYKAKKQNKP